MDAYNSALDIMIYSTLYDMEIFFNLKMLLIGQYLILIFLSSSSDKFNCEK